VDGPGRGPLGQTLVVTDLALPYFVSLPQNPTGRGVVLAHEGLGLTTQILRFAERLAEEGFTVVAPDFFFRTGGPRDEDWWTSINEMTDDEVRDDLRMAIAALPRGDGIRSHRVLPRWAHLVLCCEVGGRSRPRRCRVVLRGLRN